MPQLQEALPKYLQIAHHYRDQILSGALKAGDEVPSERQLAEDWKVSRPTATRALAALRTQGLVESRRGSGTFVRHQSLLNRRARDRYLRSKESGGMYAAGERAEIVAAEVAVAPDWVAKAFDLGLDGSAVRRHRITLDESGPVEVSTSWFPTGIGDAPRLLELTRIRQGTLAYVEEVTGRQAVFARDQIAARSASAAERRELALKGSPSALLVVHHVAYDGTGRPLECVEAVYPPDRWTFEQEYPIA